MSSDQTLNTINSICWMNGKMIINKSKDFLMKKKPILIENCDESLSLPILLETVTENCDASLQLPTLVETDAENCEESLELPDQVETDNANVVHYLLDDMQPLQVIDVNGMPSYVSEGTYIIDCDSELTGEEIVSIVTEENQPEDVNNSLLKNSEHQVSEKTIAEPANKMLPEGAESVQNITESLKQSRTVKKSQKRGIEPRKPLKKGKLRCCQTDDEDSPSDTEWEDIPDAYTTMDDLLNDLLNRKLIDTDFKELIIKGLSEMKIDIMEVLKNPICKEAPFDLLTFAYLLFFKKRRAYVYLRKVYGSRWPSKLQLKYWKELVNRSKRRRILST